MIQFLFELVFVLIEHIVELILFADTLSALLPLVLFDLLDDFFVLISLLQFFALNLFLSQELFFAFLEELFNSCLGVDLSLFLSFASTFIVLIRSLGTFRILQILNFLLDPLLFAS